jgi:hypothetical protein
MVPLTMLWLPILISAVIVFIAAMVSWMVLPHHRGDYRQMPGEDEILAAMRSAKLRAGQYSFPYARDYRKISPEMKAAMEEGPAGFVLVRKPGPLSMTGALMQYFIYLLGISLFVAYVTGRALPASADYLDVFQIAGTVAILAYAGATIPRSIWYNQPWAVTLKEVFDGVVYGLLTAGVFGWLWPRGVDI